MKLVQLLVFVLCVVMFPQTLSGMQVDVDTSKVLGSVSDYFVSFTIDQYMLGLTPKWGTFDFKSNRIKTLLSGLKPAYLRFGGSPADWEIFTDLPVSTFQGIDLRPPLITFSTTDLDNIITLTRAAGIRFLHEFDLQFRYGIQWDPANAITMLEHIKKMGYGDNLDFELGNEPQVYNPSGGYIHLEGTQIGQDYISLRKLLNKYNLNSSKLVGPDEVSLTSGLKLITEFANTAGDIINGLTFHHYYFYGPTAKVSDFINPVHFVDLENSLNKLSKALKNTTYPNTQIWIGETSDCWGAGAPNISNKYVDGFLWLDKLGLSAKMGVQVVMRQTFFGHNYPLVGDDSMPNPDYWLSYIHKLLVGTKVLNVTVAPSSGDAPNVTNTTRVYAHCTKPSTLYPKTSVTMFALNVNQVNKTSLVLPNGFTNQKAHQYLLTPHGPERLLSRQVELNGEVLNMLSETSLPPIIPLKVDVKDTITVPPLTFGFFVFPYANVKACAV